MAGKRILFGEFEFPRADGLQYLLNEAQPVTDYLFVNEPHDGFSMYFESDFPVFTVPQSSERPYCLLEYKRPDRMIRFFCPEKHPKLDSVVWYFYMELTDERGVAHGLPGQIRVRTQWLRLRPAMEKPRFIEVLEKVRLNWMPVTS